MRGGCVAGVLVGHPFDTVKVRLQVQSAEKPQYRGTLHCFQSIIKQESVSAGPVQGPGLAAPGAHVHQRAGVRRAGQHPAGAGPRLAAEPVRGGARRRAPSSASSAAPWSSPRRGCSCRARAPRAPTGARCTAWRTSTGARACAA
ncbi:Mitochondrial basic amino acids transporter [Vulpes lagopus]